MDQSRGCGVAHTAAAAAVVVEQEIVRVVRAAAVDPRDRTAHHNQARPSEPNSKGKLASLIIFKRLQCKKNVTALYLNVLIFFPRDWGMLRRSRCVLIFSLKTYVFQRRTKFVRLLPKYFASLIFFAVVPAEFPLELNSKGKLTSLNIFKGLQRKKS